MPRSVYTARNLLTFLLTQIYKLYLACGAPEAWLKFYIENIGILQGYREYWLFILHPKGQRYRTFYINWQKWNKKHFGVPTASLETYTRRNDEMSRLVPKEQTIKYQTSDGWGPLCSFLGCDVPSTMFPSLNDKNALRAILWKTGIAGIVLWSILSCYYSLCIRLSLCRGVLLDNLLLLPLRLSTN